MMADQKTILVVDDEKDISEAIADVASEVPGRKVICVSSPSEAYMRSVGTKFDLIITDFRMPKTSGADLVKVIRSQKHNSGVPILIVSAYPDEAAAKLIGILNIRYIAKPFVVDDLQKSITEMLEAPKVEEIKSVPKPLFDVNILNEFINSTSNVIRTLTGVQDIKTEKPYLYKKEMSFNIAISGVVSLQNEKIKGTIVIGFPKQTFLKLINGFTGQKFEEINSDNENHIGSILSLVKDQAIANLSKNQTTITSSELQVVTGENHKISLFDQQTTLVVPIAALVGNFYLFAAVT